MRSLLLDFLNKNSSDGPLPMYMPGHKRNFDKFPWLRELDPSLDITEITGADNFNDPETFFCDLEKIATDTWGSKHSFPIVGGSTTGILSAIYAMTKPYDRIIVGRNCHKSVYNAAELLRLKADYIYPRIDDTLGCYTRIEPADVEERLQEGDASLVVITSPTYEGFISDIAAISEICHRHGARLLVDEAHGAHLGFGGFPTGSVKLGADIVVQSLHKTLPSPTQTAILHLCTDEIPVSKVRNAISVFQSSSPSYILSSGIDACVRYMAEYGNEECEKWLNSLKLMSDLAYPNDDKSKIVLPRGFYHDVEFEMVGRGYVIAYSGLGDTEESINRLHSIVCEYNYSFSGIEKLSVTKADRAMFPFEIEGTQRVLLEEASGKISGEYIWCYPPGSPILVPGEIITDEMISLIKVLKNSEMNVNSSRKEIPEAIYCVTSLDKSS